MRYRTLLVATLAASCAGATPPDPGLDRPEYEEHTAPPEEGPPHGEEFGGERPRYNPHEDRWENSSPKDRLEYNPHEDRWEYVEPPHP